MPAPVPQPGNARAVRGDGLRTTLVWGLLVLAGLLPIFLLGLYSYHAVSQSVHNFVQEGNQSGAQVAAELVRREFEDTMDDASALAGQPGLIEAVQRRNVETARKHLQAAIQSHPGICRAFLLDGDLQTIWMEYPAAPAGRQNYEPVVREYLRKMQQTGKPTLSSVHATLPRHELVVNVAAPISGPEGKLLGAVVFHQRPAEMSRWVKKIRLGNGGHVFIIDHLGRVAAHPTLDVQNKLCTAYEKLPPVKACLEDIGSTCEYDDPTTDETMVATFVPVNVGGWPWAIVAQQSRDAAYAPIRQLKFQLWAATGILAAGALVIVLVLGRIGQQLRTANRHLAAEIAQHQRAKAAIQKEQQALKHLLEAYERHRQLVAFEIHDGLAQPLTAALMNFEALQHSAPGGPAAAKDGFAGALALLRESLAEARRLMSGLRPALLDDFGVVAAVDQLVREGRLTSGVEIEWSHQVAFARLAAPLETVLYRVIQEGLANALRHSNSPKVRIALVQEGQRIRVEIEDWGCGFDPQQVAPERFGLRGIQERARLFEGHASIESSPGRGAWVTVELPVVEAATEEVDKAV